MFMTLLVTTGLMLAAESPVGGDMQARSIVEQGWCDSFQTDAGWHPEPWQVGKPDDCASSSFGSQGGIFEVRSHGRAMAWTRTACPVWISSFPFLEADYEIVSEPTDPNSFVFLLSDGSTGPVTPGALNPENPLASGARAAFGASSQGRHRLIVDSRATFRSDRVAEITVLLSSGNGSRKIILHRLAFWATDPSGPAGRVTGSASANVSFEAEDRGGPDVVGDWVPLCLGGDKAVSTEWLGRALGVSVRWPADKLVVRKGIPFQFAGPHRAAVATSVSQTEAIQIAADASGHELALLLAARTFGSDRAWYGGTPPARGPIRSPHELVVHLEYQDGTCRSHFPWSVSQRSWCVGRLPEPYVVPLDPGKRLIRIRIDDRMTHGQVFLLAASVNRSTQPAFAPAHDREEAVVPTPPVTPKTVPTRYERVGDRLTVENGWMRLSADIGAGLAVSSLRWAPLDREVIGGPSGGSWLQCVDTGGRPETMALRDFKANRMADALDLALEYSVGDGAAGRGVTARLEIADRGEIRLTPTLAKDVAVPWQVAVEYPRITRCRIAPSMDDAWYLLGTRNMVLDHQPTTVELPYSGTFPLQLMDVFARRAGGGFGVYMADVGLRPKTFRFKQDQGGTDMSVRYDPITLSAKGRVTLPTAVLVPHIGDWHGSYAAYRQWVRSVAARPSAGRLQNAVYCRRDYPLGGTGYLFDVRSRQYRFETLIAESRRGFGGIDMIDISGWAYNERVGRVGEYRTNDLGGLPELCRAIDVAHQRHVQVGLYFEGYLVDRRTALGQKALPAWQMVGRDGKALWWPRSDKEFFVCPGVAPWRDELSKAIADVAYETHADAVYIDEFGLTGSGKVCWCGDHGHPIPSNPLVEEHSMVVAVRKALDARSPHVAIYVEFVPVDLQIPLVDAAFDLGMSMSGTPQHATKLPLPRFVFPETTCMEMVAHGIRPIPSGPEDIHASVFAGAALWLKGRSESWYSPEARRAATQAHRILRAYSDVFHSADCEPLTPTLRTDVYANRFSSPKRTIITLYNARFSDVSGDLIRTPLPSGWRVRDLWNDRPADVRREGDFAVVRGRVEPHAVGVFLLTSE